MVDWKLIELVIGPETETHIKRHGVGLSDIFNALDGHTYSRKFKIAGETRYTVLGESQGRILMTVLIQQSSLKFYLVTAYEPSESYKNLYRERCKK